MNCEISQNVIKLKTGGWNGVAVKKWSGIVFEPDELLKNPTKTFKSERGNITILKNIQIAGGKVPVVVKKTAPQTGVKKYLDYARGAKALRNFNFALTLAQKGVEAARPVAALWNNQQGSIYVAEYIPGSMNLYDVAMGKNTEIINNFPARKAVISRVAELIAGLNKCGFWHRDSKAGNFIVYQADGQYYAKFVDLDGIKRNFFGCEEKQIRTLANLAKTLTRFKTVNFTDLYRGFMVYCNSMGYTQEQSKSLLRKVERATVEMRLLSVLEDAAKFKKKCLTK